MHKYLFNSWGRAAALLALLTSCAASTAPTSSPSGVPTVLRTGLKVAYDFKPQGQSLLDISGAGHDAQLGSTAQVDANDPAWSGNTLKFNGQSSFVLAPLVTDINWNFTSYVVVKQDETSPSIGAVLAFGSSQSPDPYMIVYKRKNDSLWGLYYNTDVHEQAAQGVLSKEVKGFVLLALKRQGEQFILREVGSGQEIALPVKGKLSVDRKTIGANVRLTHTLTSTSLAQVAWQHDVNYASTPAQDQAVFTALKALLKERGIELR